MPRLVNVKLPLPPMGSDRLLRHRPIGPASTATVNTPENTVMAVARDTKKTEKCLTTMTEVTDRGLALGRQRDTSSAKNANGSNKKNLATMFRKKQCMACMQISKNKKKSFQCKQMTDMEDKEDMT